MINKIIELVIIEIIIKIDTLLTSRDIQKINFEWDILV
jgi:hypothetical protein